jgi:hypothetical protein
MEIEACMPDAESANKVQIAKYEVQTHLAQQRAISKIMAWHQKVLQLLQCHRAHGAAKAPQSGHVTRHILDLWHLKAACSELSCS